MSTEQRLDQLEIRFSHQDNFLQQLNEVVIAQEKTIERLQKEILDLKRNANGEGSVDAKRTLQDDKPPHY